MWLTSNPMNSAREGSQCHRPGTKNKAKTWIFSVGTAKWNYRQRWVLDQYEKQYALLCSRVLTDLECPLLLGRPCTRELLQYNMKKTHERKCGMNVFCRAHWRTTLPNTANPETKEYNVSDKAMTVEFLKAGSSCGQCEPYAVMIPNVMLREKKTWVTCRVVWQ